MTHPEPAHAHTEYSKITDQLYVGTNMCCGMHGQQLAKLGLTADLDLEEERQELPPTIPAYLWLPVKDHAAPTHGQMLVGATFIDAVIRGGGKVYIHCRQGHGRGPTMAAAYFIQAGLTVDEAIAKVRAGRPGAHPEPPQVGALKRFARSLKAEVPRSK